MAQPSPDCIQQFTSSKEVLQPFIYETKGSSDDITERLRQSRKQALLRKDELEAERQEVQQAACKVLHVLNDTMDVQNCTILEPLFRVTCGGSLATNCDQILL
uniref:Uncharacterized protein n=1 Tax=Physcomitrium patens TaxID=3218 RepID=A0A2K1K804_PHYPA|nr:hypothetical protein PHYPA_011802 [Physcomitrium patens]